MAGTACQNILIVEDDGDIRDSLRQVLEIEGYSVVTAENGRDAVTQLNKISRPCLILLDLMMPIMNGWEFLDRQKSDIALATIPVIVVSAAGDKAKSTHASGFIKKPIELDTLLKWVKQYCG